MNKNNQWNPGVYSKAWDFATKVHEGQTYGGKNKGERVPYINHIGSVAMEVMTTLQRTDEVLDPDLAIQCALLHDTVEDTDVTLLHIEELFGVKVANGVAALTKNEDLSTKKEQMLDSLERIKQQPKEVWIVKMADRTCNLYHPPHYWKNDKILNYQEEGKMIYDALSEANIVMAKRLLSKIEAYHAYLT